MKSILKNQNMPDHNFKFRYFLVCDDIRQEAGGKSTLVGVYDGNNLIVPFFPIVSNKIVFRLSVTLLRDDAKKFELKIKTEEDKDFLGASRPLVGHSSGDIINVQIFAQMIKFQAETKLKIFFGLDDKELTQVDEFIVRLPKNEQEWQQSKDVNPQMEALAEHQPNEK